MSSDPSNLDNWQVFEVDVSEAGLRGKGWADATVRIARERDIPLEMRFDHTNGRYLLAVPTSQHYDRLMGMVEAEFMQHFDNRMSQLRDRFRKHPAAIPAPD